MHRTSLTDPPAEFDDGDPPGFRAAMFRVGTRAGAHRTGASFYELPPGEALCPYHYELGEEEWLLVLQGRPTVRHPGGTEVLAPLDLVFFPRGPEGAHQVRNDSGEPARVLMFSDVVVPTGTVYPDSGKVGLWSERREDGGLFRQRDAVPYYTDESPPAPRG